MTVVEDNDYLALRINVKDNDSVWWNPQVKPQLPTVPASCWAMECQVSFLHQHRNSELDRPVAVFDN